MAIFGTLSISKKYKGAWFIVAGGAFIAISSLLENLWGVKAPEEFTKSSLQQYYIQMQTWPNRSIKLLEYLGWLVLTMSSIIIGIRSLRLKGISLKSALLTLFGLLICAFHIFVLFFFLEVGKSFQELKGPNLKKIENKLNQKNLPLKQKAFISKLCAGSYYSENGKRISYITETGDLKLYEPTSEELKMRELHEATVMFVDHVEQETRKYKIPYWISITLISLILGIFTPIKKAETVLTS